MIQPLVSICIPTYGRVEILHNTLDSIFSQNVNVELYEVCISDNSPTDETKEMLQKFFSDKTNICYSKSKCEGYYNSIEALKLGKGKFLKLHNNYSKFKPKMFEHFTNTLIKYENKMPVLFFAFCSISQNGQFAEYTSFDAFINKISYFSTWSTSFGIWKYEFDIIIEKNLDLDKMFPHTSLLFALTEKESFVIDNARYFDNQDVGKKGGYNLPETFGTRYLTMCKSLLDTKKITEATFQKIKDGILHFVADWYVNIIYFNNKYSFSFENWEEIIFNLYGKSGVDFIKAYTKKMKFKCFIKRILNKY